MRRPESRWSWGWPAVIHGSPVGAPRRIPSRSFLRKLQWTCPKWAVGVTRDLAVCGANCNGPASKAGPGGQGGSRSHDLWFFSPCRLCHEDGRLAAVSAEDPCRSGVSGLSSSLVVSGCFASLLVLPRPQRAPRYGRLFVALSLGCRPRIRTDEVVGRTGYCSGTSSPVVAASVQPAESADRHRDFWPW